MLVIKHSAIIVSLIALVFFSLGAAPLDAANIYNGAPRLDLPELLPHREVKMDELWSTPGNKTNYGIIDEAHVRQLVAALPNDRTYEFDLEGNSAREDLNLHLWDYDTSPETAVQLRQQIMSIIDSERPDLNIGIWGIPHYVHVAQREPENLAMALGLIEREIAYQEVTKFSDTIYISAYWRHRSPRDVSKLQQWKKEVLLKVNLAETFHGQKPRVYIWHRGYYLQPNDLLDPVIFEEMLKFLHEEGLDTIFWAGQRDTYFPEWLVDLLRHYQQKEPVQLGSH
jgi:hypothetical protein